ncbi:phage minor head protein [Allorhizobium ampelinum]|uniref:phage minor head protein n=1 Tax=Allorhizobium ampelinum TaxID=3025782 RepID=UPI000B3FC827|nr:phage minor head protein [Allorhizobium ampelinum]NTA27409.1 minor capsid protein [Allorhizobium ampelinum]OVE94465.1 hypothetical protein B7W85_13010 [Allorhizobium ampelinum]
MLVHVCVGSKPQLAFDKKSGRDDIAKFARAKKVERAYERQLHKIARAIGDIVHGLYDPTEPLKTDPVSAALDRYSHVIDEWAKAVGNRMVAEVSARDREAWDKAANRIGKGVREEIDNTPVGRIMQDRLWEQVKLIKSIPTDAAERVRHITLQGISQGKRPNQVAQEIMRSGHVSKSKATLIARTEVARTATELTHARAVAAGSTMFEWVTVGDSDVRHDHKILNGKSFRWDDPPIADQRTGIKSLPGGIWNCFPGNTKIGLGNGIKSIFRSNFTGQIVEIRASESFSATPNHPMLTTRGWVPAGEIKEGDYLIKPVGDAEFVVNANMDKRHATFEELFNAFAFAKTEHALGVEFNFYGDLPDGNVDHITFNQPLSDDEISQVLQRGSDSRLTDAYGRVVVPTRGAVNHVGEPLHSSTADELASFIISHFMHSHNVSFGPGSNGDGVFIKDPSDDVPRNSVVEGYGEFAITPVVSGNDVSFRQRDLVMCAAPRLGDSHASCSDFKAEDIRINADSNSGVFQCGTGLYQAHRVDDVSFRNHSGYVYTIETVTGWYGVSETATIAKNCRCIARPLFAEELD